MAGRVQGHATRSQICTLQTPRGKSIIYAIFLVTCPYLNSWKPFRYCMPSSCSRATTWRPSAGLLFLERSRKLYVTLQHNQSYNSSHFYKIKYIYIWQISYPYAERKSGWSKKLPVWEVNNLHNIKLSIKINYLLLKSSCLYKCVSSINWVCL